MITLTRQEYTPDSSKKCNKGRSIGGKMFKMLQELTKRVGEVKTGTKHKSIQCPWTGRFNILKTAVSFKSFYNVT